MLVHGSPGTGTRCRGLTRHGLSVSQLSSRIVRWTEALESCLAVTGQSSLCRSYSVLTPRGSAPCGRPAQEPAGSEAGPAGPWLLRQAGWQR